jgi:hypothetical protein
MISLFIIDELAKNKYAPATNWLSILLEVPLLSSHNGYL